MVLADLGRGITSALQRLHPQPSGGGGVSQEVVDAAIADICRCLLQNDVNVRLVSKLRADLRQSLNVAELPAGVNIGRVATKAMYDGLLDIVSAPPCTFTPTLARRGGVGVGGGSGGSGGGRGDNIKGKQKKAGAQVVMAVGLQGSGKTTTCSKMAHYYKGKGLRVGLVAADTFRAGAIDQLQQNAMKVRAPFYSERGCDDPVVVARNGVDALSGDCDIVIVDTSGRHLQDDDLFAEMKEIQDAVRPDLVFLVLNADIGQAAEAQARAFFKATEFGAIVITKMDGSGKGGGALSAVAATKVPILFIGMGEHMDDLHAFTPEGFVRKLMGVGDIPGLMKTLKDHVAQREYESMEHNVVGKSKKKGYMCWAELREYYETMDNMGNLSDIISMIPGLGAAVGDISKTTQTTKTKIKTYMVILDSMTMKEAWDGTGKILREMTGAELRTDSRWMRIARGSGRSWAEIEDLVKTKQTTQGVLAKTEHLTKAKGGRGGRGGLSGMGDLAGLLGGMGGGASGAGGGGGHLGNIASMLKFGR